MSRALRSIEPGVCYHVLNRGNNRKRIFFKPQDYAAFVAILSTALQRHDVELFSWCLMPNHWHLVLRPKREGALPEFMRWMTLTHVRRHHEHFAGESGHLYQGRYKSFPVARDDYFLTLCRYVEGNALRAQMVERAEHWRWSSLHQRLDGACDPNVMDWPVDRSRDWTEVVNEQLSSEELERVQTCLQRQRPLGSATWVRRIAASLGLSQTLRDRGRPRKPDKQLSPRQLRRRRAIVGHKDK